MDIKYTLTQFITHKKSEVKIMFTDIWTERLHIRKMVVSDSPSLFQIWSEPEVTRYMNIENFTNECEAIDIIGQLDKLANKNKAIRYSIIELKSNEIIGSCGFNYIDHENLKTEIGYDLRKKSWGKGYAQEAISALLDYAFHTLHLYRVEAKVEPDNIKSIKVLQKLNFVFEGTLRKTEKLKDRFIDINIYSRLRTDERIRQSQKQ